MELSEFRSRLDALKAQIEELKEEWRDDAPQWVMCKCGRRMTNADECLECKAEKRNK